MLPCDDEARLLAVALVFNVTEDQHPAFAEILVEFTARAKLGGKSGFL